MAEPLEDQGQASQQDESSCVGTVASFSGVPGTGSFLATRLELKDGLSMQYLYIGTAVPVILLLLRQALDFTYREDLVMNSLADYILQARAKKEEAAASRRASETVVCEKQDPAFQEEW